MVRVSYVEKPSIDHQYVKSICKQNQQNLFFCSHVKENHRFFSLTILFAYGHMLNFLLNVNKEDLNIGTECTTVSFPLGKSSLTASFLGFILFQPSNCAGCWYLTYLTNSNLLGFIISQGNFTPECSWPSNRVGAFIINHPNPRDKWDICIGSLSCSISASQEKIIQTHPIMNSNGFHESFHSFPSGIFNRKTPQNISKSFSSNWWVDSGNLRLLRQFCHLTSLFPSLALRADESFSDGQKLRDFLPLENF